MDGHVKKQSIAGTASGNSSKVAMFLLAEIAGLKMDSVASRVGW